MTNSTEPATLGIEAVSQRSGLSQHLIRLWERRYAAVKPHRTNSNRRLYSEDDVVRLELLNRAVHAGHRIGDVANIPTAKLEKLIGNARPSPPVLSQAGAGNASSYVTAAIEAIERFDTEGLSAVLAKAEVDFSQARALEQVFMPLMERIGEMWKDGELRIGNEHMATAVVTHHLGSALDNFRYETTAPAVVVATPLGQLHEAGALAAAVMAAGRGWRPIYLGSNLPAEEIAGAVIKSGATALAMSLVYPADDPRIPTELSRLKKVLPHDTEIIVGGRAAEAYRPAIEACGAALVTTADSFKERLEFIRSKPRKARN